MTNKEWLMSLTDEQLAEWLCDRLIVRDIEDEFRYVGLSAVKFENIDSVKGIIEWLGQSKVRKSTTEDDDPEVIKQHRIIEIRDEISKLYEELEKLTTIEHI